MAIKKIVESIVSAFNVAPDETEALENALRELHKDRQTKVAAENRIKEWTKYLMPYINAAEDHGLECGVMTGTLIEGCQHNIKRDLLRGLGVSDKRIDKATVDSPFSWIKTKVIL